MLCYTAQLCCFDYANYLTSVWYRFPNKASHASFFHTRKDSCWSSVKQMQTWPHTMVINLKQLRKCNFGSQQLTGIQCLHAISSIYYCLLYLYSFVNKYLKMDAYLTTYNGKIMDVLFNEDEWPNYEFLKLGQSTVRKK